MIGLTLFKSEQEYRVKEKSSKWQVEKRKQTWKHALAQHLQDWIFLKGFQQIVFKDVFGIHETAAVPATLANACVCVLRGARWAYRVDMK